MQEKLRIMSLVDHEGSVEYPFSQNTVFKALMAAIKKLDSFSLDSADELSGRVVLKSGISLASWGENIPIQLVSITPNRTTMKVMSTPKTGIMFGGANDLGKNRRNIEKIIAAVSKELSNMPKEQEVSVTPSSEEVIDSLVKLKGLLDSGAINKEEYEEQKKNLLSSKSNSTSSTASVQQHVANEDTKPIKIESSSSDTSLLVWLTIGAIAIIVISMLTALA